ncbi:MAG: chaperone NapD [Candidatus Thiodiazotropha sp. (ex Lucinoma annulata)]|nr:chaperone NapD [Candidatus Thiodiazotropha sp. (ex Lucinoma annulata)]
MTICSLVVQALPEKAEHIATELVQLEGVEIHVTDPSGKIIVTIDHPDHDYCTNTFVDMNHMNGVMSTALVYEYSEHAKTAQEKPQ